MVELLLNKSALRFYLSVFLTSLPLSNPHPHPPNFPSYLAPFAPHNSPIALRTLVAQGRNRLTRHDAGSLNLSLRSRTHCTIIEILPKASQNTLMLLCPQTKSQSRRCCKRKRRISKVNGTSPCKSQTLPTSMRQPVPNIESECVWKSSQGSKMSILSSVSSSFADVQYWWWCKRASVID